MARVTIDDSAEPDLHLSFGDGVDLSSLSNLLVGLNGKNVQIDGVDYRLFGFCWTDTWPHEWGLSVAKLDDDGNVGGGYLVLPYSQAKHIHVY